MRGAGLWVLLPPSRLPFSLFFIVDLETSSHNVAQVSLHLSAMPQSPEVYGHAMTWPVSYSGQQALHVSISHIYVFSTYA